MPATADPIESILAAAVEIGPEADRRAYVERACAGDAELRSRVEELIDNHFRAGSFLESAALAETADQQVSERPGTMVGAYKLLEQIGEGGFGVVYLAEQIEPVRRKVALKVLKPGMDTRQVVARFEAERQALAIMDHPNIARVFDGGATPSGRPYFAMELVRGVPVTSFCDQNRLTPGQRLELFLSVCQAVQHAHQKGVIHRDLKPSNVLVGLYDGKPVVKVIDFGVAKAAGAPLTEKTLHTGFGAVVGTPEYMSPEQATLDNVDVDTRSDIYSLGVLLYELLTGTTPVSRRRLKEATLLEVLRLVREEDPPRPSTRLSGTEELRTIAANRGLEPKKLSGVVRGELDWIVMKALEKDRNRRYETANALAMDVQRYLKDEPVLACPPSAGYRLRKFARRNKRAMATGTLLGVMLVATAGAVTASALWAASRAEAAKKDLEFNLYLRNIPLAQVEARHFNWGGVEDLLKECPERLRGWEFHYLTRLPNAPLHDMRAPVTGGISTNLDLAFSHDGRFLAGPGPDGTVTFWDLASGNAPRALKGKGRTSRVLCVAFRPPDGRLLVSAHQDGSLRFWDTESGQESDAIPAHTGEIVGLTFSSDGQLLATIGADDWVRVWNVADRKERRRFPTVYVDQARMLRRAAFSPDGRLLAFGAGNAVKVWDVTNGQVVHSFEEHTGLVYSVAFSREGDRLLSASWDLTAKVWDLVTGRSFTMYGHAAAAWAVEFSPDGKLVAVAGGVADPAIKIYDARTGKLKHTLEGHATRVGCIAFHPDGNRLVSCGTDQTVRIWELDRGKEVLALREHTDLVTRVLFDPKGRWLAASCDDRTLRVWDGIPANEAAGRPCVTLTGHTRQVFGLDFSPDGDLLASASQDHTVRVWDVAGGRAVHAFADHTDTVFAVAFGRDGLLVSGSYDGTTRVWNARKGTLDQVLPGSEARARGVALSHNGTHLVTSSIAPPFQISLWDVRWGENGPRIEKRPRPLTGHSGPAFSVKFSPDDRCVVSTGTDAQLILSNAATGEKKFPLARPNSSDRAWAVAFHPVDGRHLAAGYAKNRVMIWDYTAKPKAPTKFFDGHTNDVYCVAYSSDGRWLASASWNEVIIWDTANDYREVRRIGGFRGQIWSVAWCPERPVLAVGGGHWDSGTIELWDLAELPARAARANPGR